MSDRDDLPVPTTARWQPLRLGLLNLYRFDDEQFRFAGGRLLLRGNNGTGKSRVLALSLPFLLDGEVASHRLEPDGDRAKRVEWNLLLGRHDDRLGYTWIEFGRLDDDGTPHFVTLGIGMRAVKGRGLASRWYFVTGQRIATRAPGDAHPIAATDDPVSDVSGRLSLVAEAGQALTRDRLRAATEGHGAVFDTAQAYRAEVDRRLFGLGEHRYDALVDLLIQLRRPQLSRQMDEQVLSDALSEALPPLPRAVVGDVAEAFRTLEADRQQLTSFSAAAAATATFLDTYRRYAAVAVRRRAQQVTTAHSDYERAQRRLREAERDRDEADDRLAGLTADRDRARDAEHHHTEQVRTLDASPAMDRVRELEHARRAATEAAARVAEVETDRDRAAERVAALEGRLTAAADRRETSRDAVAEADDRATATAAAAVLAPAHDRAVADLGLADVVDGDAVAAARAAADAEVVRRRGALDHLRGLAAEVGNHAGTVATAGYRRDELATQLDAARDDERDAVTGREQAVADLIAGYRRWAADLSELAVPAADELAWELETWRDAQTDRSPLARAVAAAVAAATTSLADERAAARRAQQDLAAQRDALAAERDHASAARHLPPPAPHTRVGDARDARPGAPLWQLVEPAADLDTARVAGYEAALEAAGLLDAWVSPDGRVLDPDDHDVALVAADLPAAPDGGLAAVLVPAIDPDDPQASAVDPAVVRVVLERIGRRAGDGVVWVADDGRHRVGPLQGAWTKPAAEHLGHAAREQARRARLAELDAQLTELDAHLADGDAALARLDQRGDRLAEEHVTAPTDTPIREAAAAHVAAVRQVAGLRARLAEAEAVVVAATARLDQARATHDEAATDLGLADHADDLDGLERALADHATALAALWPTLTAHVGVLADHARATADLAAAAAEYDGHTDRVRHVRDAATAATTRRDTLEATVGEEADALLARLEQARADLTSATRRREQLDEDRVTASGHRQAAQQRMDDLAEALDGHAAGGGAAIVRLVAAADAGLLPVADAELAEVAADAPGGGWSADRGVRLARRVDQLLQSTEIDDPTWTRVQRGIHGHYADLEHALLPHDLHPTASLADDLFVVTAPFQGAAQSMPALHGLLVDEVTHRQALLTAREREVLQNHLLGDVAAHLHGLLREGEDWVAEVNAELDRMPTSTGMKLRFAWQPRTDLPTFAAARRHLLGHHAGWTPEQREEIGAFLQERIAQVREADPTGTWPAHLEAALDHRGWHHFVVERHQDGQWTRLNRRSHGTGSGGEKALALTVPQFAAAAAHYRSAAPHAPRLIMLDEAFVGIDASMRAKCLGLLEQFDLDLVMTSEREWGCYPTVPALAIAQLATRPGIDAVGVSRWVWNGRERVRADA
ncbi:MAG: TIGR02680 family protein [Egicoccus sp.]